MISEIRPNCAHKNTQVFFTWQLEKKMFKASVS